MAVVRTHERTHVHGFAALTSKFQNNGTTAPARTGDP